MATRSEKPKVSEPLKRAPLDVDAFDFENPSEREAFLEELQGAAAKRVKTEVKKLRDAGIIDPRGNRKSKKFPADMRPDSRCNLPG